MSPRVLVVDDDADMREMMRLSLSLENIETLTASSAPDALVRLRATPAPALVFLDLRMPGMNGLELLAVMKADPDLAKIPVVVFTGDAAAREAAVSAGAVETLAKPADLEAIAGLVHRFAA